MSLGAVPLRRPAERGLNGHTVRRVCLPLGPKRVEHALLRVQLQEHGLLRGPAVQLPLRERLWRGGRSGGGVKLKGLRFIIFFFLFLILGRRRRRGRHAVGNLRERLGPQRLVLIGKNF